MLEEQKDRVTDKGIDAATITISYFMCLSVRMKHYGRLHKPDKEMNKVKHIKYTQK